MSSISTYWSIQSISIKSDLPIFIDLSIVKSIPIFYGLTTPGFNRRSDKPGSSYLRGRPRQAYCSYCIRKTLIRYHNGRRQPSPFAQSLGKSGRVSLGDITAHGRVQDWPSRERLGTRLGRRHLLVWRKALN